MLLRLVLGVSLNEDLLNHADISDVLVIVVVAVDILLLDQHVKLIDVEAESLGDLHAEVPDSLEVGHLHLLLDSVGPEDYLRRQRLVVAVAGLLLLGLERLLALVAIKEL